MFLLALILSYHVQVIQLTMSLRDIQPTIRTVQTQRAQAENEYQGNTEDTDGIQPTIHGLQLQ